MHSLIVEYLQRELETQNGIKKMPNVRDFLITSEERAKLSDADTQEQVFVGEEHLAVYIAEPVLERLDNRTFNLDDYCVAAEGVSHYLYLMNCAEQARKVSLLELELQAEVDKFVHVSRKFRMDEHALIDTLFERYSLHAHLSPEERERYRAASHHAARFCYKLVSRVSDRATTVRDFFTRTLQGKLRLAAT